MYFFIKQVDGSMNAGGVVVEGGGGAYNQKFTVSMFCCPFRIGSFL